MAFYKTTISQKSDLIFEFYQFKNKEKEGILMNKNVNV